MSYTHLSIIERSKLEILRRQCQISRAIVKELGRHPSTICRELDRATSSKPYHAEQAQSAYEERRKASISLGKWSEAIRHDIDDAVVIRIGENQVSLLQLILGHQRTYLRFLS